MKNEESKNISILPVYNVEKYLSECLDSIVNQTLKDKGDNQTVERRI